MALGLAYHAGFVGLSLAFVTLLAREGLLLGLGFGCVVDKGSGVVLEEEHKTSEIGECLASETVEEELLV